MFFNLPAMLMFDTIRFVSSCSLGNGTRDYNSYDIWRLRSFAFTRWEQFQYDWAFKCFGDFEPLQRVSHNYVKLSAYKRTGDVDSGCLCCCSVN